MTVDDEHLERIMALVERQRDCVDMQALPLLVGEFRHPVSLLEESGVRVGYVRWSVTADQHGNESAHPVLCFDDDPDEAP